jgi:hypothetical protein
MTGRRLGQPADRRGILDLAPRSTSAGNDHDVDPARVFVSRIGGTRIPFSHTTGLSVSATVITRSPVKRSTAAVKTSQGPTKSISSAPSKSKIAIVFAIPKPAKPEPNRLK